MEGRNTNSPGLLTIGGLINTASAVALNNVNVTLSSTIKAQSLESNNLGQFKFDDQTARQTYMLTADMQDDPLNGVTTLDLIHIQKHILGLNKLKTPTQLIAADVDASGSISAIDLVHLRQLILGVIDDFPNNSVWNFVPTNKLYSTPHSDLLNNLKKYIEIKNADIDHVQNNFTGIKTGDVNLDNSYEKNASARSSNTISLDYEIVQASEGSQVRLYLGDDVQISGLQMTLSFDDPILSIDGLLSNFTSNNYSLNGNSLTISWNSKSSVAIDQESPILIIGLNGNKTSYLATDLEGVSPEIYTASLTSRPMRLERKKSIHSESSLSIIPNPMNNIGTVLFNSEKAGIGVLDIYRTDGTRVYTKSSQLNKGANHLILNTDDFSNTSSGIYIAKFTANGTVQTKQFSIVN